MTSPKWPLIDLFIYLLIYLFIKNSKTLERTTGSTEIFWSYGIRAGHLKVRKNSCAAINLLSLRDAAAERMQITKISINSSYDTDSIKASLWTVCVYFGWLFSWLPGSFIGLLFLQLLLQSIRSVYDATTSEVPFGNDCLARSCCHGLVWHESFSYHRVVFVFLRR